METLKDVYGLIGGGTRTIENPNYVPPSFSFIEAVELMKQGKKLTHRFFSKDEWVTMEGLTMVFEDGVKCSPQQFLMNRPSLAWNEDWSEFNHHQER